MQAQPVLDFAFTEIMQARLPIPVLAQVLRHVRRQKNMPGIAAIHHALRNIDSRTGYVRFLINISDSVDRTAVNSHPQADVWMILQCSANLERTPGRLFRTVKKNERHPIAGRHSDELAACFRSAERFRHFARFASTVAVIQSARSRAALNSRRRQLAGDVQSPAGDRAPVPRPCRAGSPFFRS